MARRAETQERNRVRVLAAAREEFAERGFRDAKVDAIAERVGLTRGAVYSNFPGKRALYLAVLAAEAEAAHPPASLGTASPGTASSGTASSGIASRSTASPGTASRSTASLSTASLSTASSSTASSSTASPSTPSSSTPGTALGEFALAWLSAQATDPWLGRDLFPELAAEDLRRPYEQLLKLQALLLGLALERLTPHPNRPGDPPTRSVRQATAILSALHGAHHAAATAPGFLQPYDVVSACEHLATLTLNDYWAPPDDTAPVRTADEPWTPPAATDLVTNSPFVATDGVVAVLGLNRLAVAEEAIRRDAPTTVVIVTGRPAELGPLARLSVAGVCGPLRRAFPAHAHPAVRVVCDETGAFARAAGVPAVSDETETAVRVRDGRIVARADGFAACHAVAEPNAAPNAVPR